MSRLHVNGALATLLTLAALATPAPAGAQAPRQSIGDRGSDVASRTSRTFGPLAETSYTVQAFAFSGLTATDSARFAANLEGSRYCTAAPCSFEAAVSLPAGALVTAIELEACDADQNAGVIATLFRQTPLESSFVAIATASTGVTTAMPGCKFFRVPLAIPETIDNYNNTYQLEVALDGATQATRFQAVRLFYTLQVSPGPAIATFDDVSVLHPFFRFIEALSASGITAGCSASPPLFCPDDPITRAQMAVFLSKALGLQWAP